MCGPTLACHPATSPCSVADPEQASGAELSPSGGDQQRSYMERCTRGQEFDFSADKTHHTPDGGKGTPSGFVRKGGRPVTWIGGGGMDPKRLATLGVPQLRSLFADVFGEQTASNNAAWLRRKLAESPDETFGRGRCPTVRARDVGAAIWSGATHKADRLKPCGSTGQLHAMALEAPDVTVSCGSPESQADKRNRRAPKRSVSCFAGSSSSSNGGSGTATAADIFGRRSAASETGALRSVLTWESFGNHLANSTVEVYWPADDTWWTATVMHADKAACHLQLLYSNMQEEEISGPELMALVCAGQLSESYVRARSLPTRRPSRRQLSAATAPPLDPFFAGADEERRGSNGYTPTPLGGFIPPTIKEEANEEGAANEAAAVDAPAAAAYAHHACGTPTKRGSPKRARTSPDAAPSPARTCDGGAPAASYARCALTAERVAMHCALLQAQAAAPASSHAQASVMVPMMHSSHPGALAGCMFEDTAAPVGGGSPGLAAEQRCASVACAAATTASWALAQPFGCPGMFAAGGGGGGGSSSGGSDAGCFSCSPPSAPRRGDGGGGGAARPDKEERTDACDLRSGWLCGALSHSEEEDGGSIITEMTDMQALEELVAGGAGGPGDEEMRCLWAKPLAGGSLPSGDDCMLAVEGLRGLFDY